jgi:ELWxxDGT repeat protein
MLRRLLPTLAALGVLAGAGAVPAAAADGPRMIEDLRPGEAGLDNGQLGVIGVLGRRVVFRADADDGKGSEVYRTDGTAAGTGLLLDINPGPDGSSASFEWRVLDGVGYFTASDGTHGDELWRTNGTRAGTRMVVDIAPGPDDFAYLWGTY